MTDLEMTKLCAKAMGLPLYYPFGRDAPHIRWTGPFAFGDTSDEGGALKSYWPLQDNAQAMALVKQVGLSIGALSNGWKVFSINPFCEADNADLNRAIVECCARVQASKLK